MEAFLRSTVGKLALLNTHSSTVHVVIGNEACDLDSAVSAICYAFWLSLECAADDSATAAEVVFVPLLAIERHDYRLRVDCRRYLGEECGITDDLLVFLNDLDLFGLCELGRLELTLVDHNEVSPGLLRRGCGERSEGSLDLTACVRRIIDHHVLASATTHSRCQVTVEPVGSCCTLVSEAVLRGSVGKMAIDRTTARLLYGTILLDTVCLSSTAGRATQKDLEMVHELEVAFGFAKSERLALFDLISQAKSDVSSLSTVDLLRRDKKEAKGQTTALAVSSILVDLESLLRRQHLFDDVRRFILDERSDAAVLLLLSGSDSSAAVGPLASEHDSESPLPQRHLILFSDHVKLRTQVCEALLASDIKLRACENSGASEPCVCVFVQDDYRQGRKKVLPVLQKFVDSFDSIHAGASRTIVLDASLESSSEPAHAAVALPAESLLSLTVNDVASHSGECQEQTSDSLQPSVDPFAALGPAAPPAVSFDAAAFWLSVNGKGVSQPLNAGDSQVRDGDDTALAFLQELSFSESGHHGTPTKNDVIFSPSNNVGAADTMLPAPSIGAVAIQALFPGADVFSAGFDVLEFESLGSESLNTAVAVNSGSNNFNPNNLDPFVFASTPASAGWESNGRELIDPFGFVPTSASATSNVLVLGSHEDSALSVSSQVGNLLDAAPTARSSAAEFGDFLGSVGLTFTSTNPFDADPFAPAFGSADPFSSADAYTPASVEPLLTNFCESAADNCDPFDFSAGLQAPSIPTPTYTLAASADLFRLAFVQEERPSSTSSVDDVERAALERAAVLADAQGGSISRGSSVTSIANTPAACSAEEASSVGSSAAALQSGSPWGSRSISVSLSAADGHSYASGNVPDTPHNSFLDSSLFDMCAAFAVDSHEVAARFAEYSGSLSSTTVIGDRQQLDATWTNESGLATDAAAMRIMRQQLEPYHHHDSTSMPLTPVNSYADSFKPWGRDAAAIAGQRDIALLPSFNSAEMVQKILDKKASLDRGDFGVDEAVEHLRVPYTPQVVLVGPPGDSMAEEGVFAFESDELEEVQRAHFEPDHADSVVARSDSAVCDTPTVAMVIQAPDLSDTLPEAHSKKELSVDAGVRGESIAPVDVISLQQIVTTGGESAAVGDGAAVAVQVEASSSGSCMAVEVVPAEVPSVAAAAALPAVLELTHAVVAQGINNGEGLTQSVSTGKENDVEANNNESHSKALTVARVPAVQVYVNYLASVDPLHGHLDLVGRSSSSNPTQAVAKRRTSLVERLEAQIVEGVDPEEMEAVAPGSTAAAIFTALRRSSADGSGAVSLLEVKDQRAETSNGQMPPRTSSFGTATSSSAADCGRACRVSFDEGVISKNKARKTLQEVIAGIGSDVDMSDHHDSSDENYAVGHPECSVQLKHLVTEKCFAARSNNVHGTADDAAQATGRAQLHCSDYAALAEAIVAQAVEGAMTKLHSQSATGEEVEGIDGEDNATVYAEVAHEVVAIVLAETSTRLRASNDDAAATCKLPVSHGEPAGTGGAQRDSEAQPGLKYSDTMIDAILGYVEEEVLAPATSVLSLQFARPPPPVADGDAGHPLPPQQRLLVPDVSATAISPLASPTSRDSFPSSPAGDSMDSILDEIDELETPDDVTPAFFDSAVLRELQDSSTESCGSLTTMPPPLTDIALYDKAEDKAEWCDVTVAGIEHRVDMTAIKPFCKILAHGGNYGEKDKVLLVFSACYFPQKSLRNYGYIMDNLMLYVLSGIELMVPDGFSYAILYFHGGADKSQLPGMAFLKRCRAVAHPRLRKSLKAFYLVHPTMWLRTVVFWSKAVVSSKFSKKVHYMFSLEQLRKAVSLEYVTVPPEVVEYDSKRKSQDKK